MASWKKRFYVNWIPVKDFLKNMFNMDQDNGMFKSLKFETFVIFGDCSQ